MQKLLSLFEFTIPDTWARNYFLYVLFINGHVAILNTDKFGVIPQHCTLYGHNVFYQPTNVMIANPLLSAPKDLKIDKDAALIKLTDDYCGIGDVISYYADLMAVISHTATLNIYNSKLSYVFSAPNSRAVESYKAMYDKISMGKPAVFIDSGLGNLAKNATSSWQLFNTEINKNFIAPELIAQLEHVDNQFNTWVGIPNNSNPFKKERQIVDEVNANNVETESRASVWLENIKAGCEKANNMFGLNLSVDWRIKPQDVGGMDNVSDISAVSTTNK